MARTCAPAPPPHTTPAAVEGYFQLLYHVSMGFEGPFSLAQLQRLMAELRVWHRKLTAWSPAGLLTALGLGMVALERFMRRVQVGRPGLWVQGVNGDGQGVGWVGWDGWVGGQEGWVHVLSMLGFGRRGCNRPW